MDNNREWENVLPFGIDSGELDSLTLQDAFVRGFEVGAIYGAATHYESGSDTIKMIIHSDNEARCIRFADAKKFEISERKWLNDDWCELTLKRV